MMFLQSAPFEIPNQTGLIPFMGSVSDATGGIFWTMMLIALGITLLMLHQKHGWSRAMMVSSFVTTFTAVAFNYFGLISSWLMGVSIVYMLGAFIFLVIEQ